MTAPRLILFSLRCHWSLLTLVSLSSKMLRTPTFNTTTACGYVAISFGATDGTLLSDPILKDWTTAYWSLDFVVNTMATSSIVFRLWSAGQSVRGRGNPQNRYLGLIMTLVESGTIYFVMTTVIFILVLTQTATVVPVLDVAAQLAVRLSFQHCMQLTYINKRYSILF